MNGFKSLYLRPHFQAKPKHHKNSYQMSRPYFNHILTQDVEVPHKFNFPFCYDPHPLAIIAAEDLQQYIKEHLEGQHDFGSETTAGIGKMFGVLVVKDKNGQIGYLSAFSGKLGNKNFYSGFVPPVFDTLNENGFYKKGEAETNIINRQIESLESDKEYIDAQNYLEAVKIEAVKAIDLLKIDIRQAKADRNKRREQAQTLSGEEYQKMMADLDLESIKWHYSLKEMNKLWKNKIQLQEAIVLKYKSGIDALKVERKKKSADLQQKLFEQYTFLNQYGQKKSLMDIFEITGENTPPSGAGECAAPKLLHFAFKHNYRPITMAEFWWGKSPSSEIRKQGLYYPACNGKCKPILGHMLEGIMMEDNPLLINPAIGKNLDIIFEDEYLLVINKPPEFLSVPGKKIEDSVQTRMQQLYPKATGPLIVHRLDMSTSGIMLIAKSKDIHHHLQGQFIKRTVKKRYEAILDGKYIGKSMSGEIKLPLRVDLDDRPRQLVCYEYGKSALTKWEIIQISADETRIYFYPVTGRTHQLRVHASHPSGLNLPIKGDDLYGTRSDRLYLHAGLISFVHPVTKETIQLEASPEF